jgi:nucleotide-binding universal stress UspA family protein
MPSPIRTVMIAVALDERDMTTIAHAAHVIASTRPESIYLIHVKSSTHAGAAQAAIGPAEDAPLRAQLESLAAGLAIPSGVKTEAVVAHGDVIETLLKHAGKSSTDLLILGRSTDDRSDESTRGAVSVLRKIPCSLLIVPAGAPVAYDRIVVATDFSTRSGEAAELAAQLTKPGGELAMLHVYAPPLGYHKLGQTYEHAAETVRQEAEREFQAWSPKLDLAGRSATPQFQIGEDVSEAIVDYADEQNANLVVVASHGRTQPAALLLGHVADDVSRQTIRPMLCVKRKGEVVNLVRAIAQLYEWD